MAMRLRACALFLLLGLAGCGASIQPCEGTPRQSIGPCAIGAPKDSGGG